LKDFCRGLPVGDILLRIGQSRKQKCDDGSFDFHHIIVGLYRCFEGCRSKRRTTTKVIKNSLKKEMTIANTEFVRSSRSTAKKPRRKPLQKATKSPKKSSPSKNCFVYLNS